MIHVYPGMGATSAMYPDPWRALPDSVFHDWPEWRGEATIEALAERLIAAHRIVPGDTVIGSSLGGIVGCEIANRIQLDRLILIGSATRKEEIGRGLSLLRGVAGFVPFKFLTALAGWVPCELAKQFSQADPRFIRSLCKAIFAWDGLRSSVRITRIHGRRDWIIPLPGGGIDFPINGGHLIAMTHAEACVEIVAFR